MAVDPDIKKKANDIRTKIYGGEVRESLASGIEEMSEDVVDNTGRQDAVEEQFQQVIENTTDKDVISAPEIIAARNGKNNLKQRLDDDHQEVTAQLAQNERNKVDKNGDGQINYANLAPDVRSKFTGDKVAYVGPEAVGNVNMTPNSVTTTESEFIQKSTNLFDGNNVMMRKIISVSGDITDNPGWLIGHKIRISPSSDIYTRYITYIAWYDESDNFISRSDTTPGALPSSFWSAPDNAYYLRPLAKIDSNAYGIENMQLSLSDVEVPYEPFYQKIKNIETDNISRSAVTNAEIAPKAVSAGKTDFIEKSTNLFNKKAVHLDKRISSDGIINDQEGYGYSHVIETEPEETYYLNGVYEVAWYDKFDNFISRDSAPGSTLGWFIESKNVATHFRVNFNYGSQTWEDGKVQVSKSKKPIPYEEFYLKFIDDLDVRVRSDDSGVFLNVKDYGAVGDGVTDDTAPIKNAVADLKEIGGGRLYMPSGVYMISSTIVLPSNIILSGEGMRTTVIKAIEGTVFDLYELLQNGHNRQKYRTMLTFETSGEDGLDTLDNLTSNVHIQDLTVDWNFSPSNHEWYSVAPILVDRAKQITFLRVKVAHPVQQEDNKRSGCAIMFSFSKQCYMYNCELDKADYEALCVRYLSKDIRFINSTILDNFPTDRYSYLPSHYLQVARPTNAAPELRERFGEELAGPLYVEGCYFEVNTDFVSDLACVHYSKGFYFRNNTIRHTGGDFGSGQTLIKPLDHAEDIEVSGNYFDWSAFSGSPTQVPGLISIPREAGNCKNIKFNNNIVKIYLPDSIRTFDNKHLIGINRGTNDNAEIKDNFVHITGYPNTAFNVFSIMQGEISGNKILAENPSETITENGPRGFITFSGTKEDSGEKTVIKDNTIMAPGKLGVGIEVKDADLINGVFEGNDFEDTVLGYKETEKESGELKGIKWQRFKDNKGVFLKGGTATLVTGQSPALSIPINDVRGINFNDRLINKANVLNPVSSRYKFKSDFVWNGSSWELEFDWIDDPGENIEIEYKVEVDN